MVPPTWAWTSASGRAGFPDIGALAGVNTASTISALAFSISKWPMKHSRRDWPSPLMAMLEGVELPTLERLSLKAHQITRLQHHQLPVARSIDRLDPLASEPAPVEMGEEALGEATPAPSGDGRRVLISVAVPG